MSARPIPVTRSYSLPGSRQVAEAFDGAFDALSGSDPAGHQAARVVCTILAAAVCDALTDFDPDGPFDAVGLELLLDAHGDVETSGRIWRSDGSKSAITDSVWLFDVGEWTEHLTGDNASTWSTLCSPLPSTTALGARFVLDLVRASQLR